MNIVLTIITLVSLISTDVVSTVEIESVNRQTPPIVRMMPPPGFVEIAPGRWRMTAYPLRDLINNPYDWETTRSLLDYLCYFDYNIYFNYSVTPNSLSELFAQLNAWNLKLSLETRVLKEYCFSGEEAYEMSSVFWDLFEEHGAVISEFAMDEPFYAMLYHGPFPDPYSLSVTETADYLELMRERYGNSVLIGDIEPYPAITKEEIIWWIENLNQECFTRNIQGIDFISIDPNWNEFDYGNGSWEELREIEEYCDMINMPFSLIYWASDAYGSLDDEDWYNGIMTQGNEYAAVGGTPDEYVIESWMKIPQLIVPETQPFSFTYSFLAFYNAYIGQSTMSSELSAVSTTD